MGADYDEDWVDRITEEGASTQQSTNLSCSPAPDNKSKAGGATKTTTAERGGKNWGNDWVNGGAEWSGATMTTKTTTTTKV